MIVPVTKTLCTLGEYGANRIWFSSCSMGYQAGETFEIDDVQTCGVPDAWFELEGDVDGDGTWHWMGKGDPVDEHGATVRNMRAWVADQDAS
jgi:hypothetical protein